MKINLVFIRSDISSSNPYTDNQKEAFLGYLKECRDISLSDNGTTMFFIESGGTEEKFKKIYKDYNAPYIFIATDANNSLPATLEICSFLRKNNLAYKIIHDELSRLPMAILSESNKKEAKLEKINQSNKILKGYRLGVVGKPSDWLISSDVDYKKAKDVFGSEIIDITFEEFKSLIEAKLPYSVNDDIMEHVNSIINGKDVEDALYIYSALKEIIRKYNLNGLTVRCFDLLSTVKATSCLALALLNSEGIIATCEGDVPAMLSMALIYRIFHQSSFQANPSLIKEDEGYIYLAHCTLPLDMTTSFRYDTHFESGIGLGIKGELLPAEITIFKLSSNLEEYMILEGKIETNLDIKSLCRTQVKVRINDNIHMIKASPCGNHLIAFYGYHKDELINKLK